jgi:hypothetical protein
MNTKPALVVMVVGSCTFLLFSDVVEGQQHTENLFKTYCFDCHDDGTPEADLSLPDLFSTKEKDATLVFENLITNKMPPNDAGQPDDRERLEMLGWLAKRESKQAPKSFRRISRHEFVQAVNDLLGIRLDLSDSIPDDRGTQDFESDRKIALTSQMLGAYFAAADEMLEFALPDRGFEPERVWVSNSIMDSNPAFHGLVRKYQEGLLFSWIRQNNGSAYSFFYDKFEPPVAGWYDLTFDAAKLGDFEEDISVMVFAGKWYLQDDRPQPQRLLDVISLSAKEVNPYTVRAFLRPGENVSVHCYSKHTYGQKSGDRGAYIKQLKVRGPVFDQWPPRVFGKVFTGLKTEVPARELTPAKDARTALQVTIPSSSEDELKAVIWRFAERAFASTLTEDELSPYYQVSLQTLTKHGDFIQAAKAGIKAVICSPRFLYAPGVHANASQRTAGTLARTLWLSVPDAELLQRVAQDNFTAGSVRDEIQRMLRDERSQRMVHSLCDQWLNLRSFNKVSPSLKLYPKYDDLLNHFLPLETEAYLHYLIKENLPVSYLIDSDFSILNQRLAQHYGVDGVYGQQMRKIRLDPQSPRGGLLTMGSVLKATTDGFDTSPILRGAWISKNIAGNTLAPPPDNVKAIEPDPSHATTLREQIEVHKNNATCYACHKSIDPYGFALERFDATGQWRAKYRVEKPHSGTFQFRLEGYYGLAGEVDSSGEIDDTKFDNVFGLKQILLSRHRQVAYNFAKKFFEYANGFKPTLKQRLDLFELIPEKAENCRMRDLLTEVLVYSFARDYK